MAEDFKSPDMQAWARDWITIWQSEVSALAGDREAREAWVRGVALWAEAAERAARLLPGQLHPHDGTSGSARAAEPPRPAAPVAASDPRDATIRDLGERIAELERRLASLAEHAARGVADAEPGPGAAGGDSGVPAPPVPPGDGGPA